MEENNSKESHTICNFASLASYGSLHLNFRAKKIVGNVKGELSDVSFGILELGVASFEIFDFDNASFKMLYVN